MDKYTKEIREVTHTVKKDFMSWYDNKYDGIGYYNWNALDEKIIEMVIREMWKRTKEKNK